MHLTPRHLIAVGMTMLLSTAAARLSAQAQTADHPGQYDRADIEAGSRLYDAQCAGCHGVNGDQVVGVDLRRGAFRTAISDDDLARVLATGRPDAGMPAFASFQPGDITAVIAFIRAGFDANGAAVKIGTPARGQALFSDKGRCATCHRVNGNGPHVASDLSDIGAIRSPAAMQRVLLDPASNLLPANRTLQAVTRDGRTIRGRRLNEDTYTVQLLDEQERLVSLVKSELRSLDAITTSSMPSYRTSLTADELSDVIAYLLTLKGMP